MERGQGYTPSELQPQQTPELSTQYGILFSKEIAEQKLPNAEATIKVIEEIDRQAVESLTTFDSEMFPGTRLTRTTFDVTPETLQRIFGTPEEPQTPHNETAEPQAPSAEWFLFGAFDNYPRGGAHQSLDMGADRFFRALSEMAAHEKRGEAIGPIRIHSLGSGTGVGETVSQDYVDGIGVRNGFDARGKVNAEFIQRTLAAEGATNDTTVGIEGVSLGASTVEATLQHLPPDLAEKAKKRIVNAVGHPKKAIHKSAKIAGGIVAENTVRKFFDHTLQFVQSDGDTRMEEVLKARFGEDTPEQKALKGKLAMKSAYTAVLGTPINRNAHRYYETSSLYDPLTTGVVKMAKAELSKRKTHITPGRIGHKKAVLAKHDELRKPDSDPEKLAQLTMNENYYKTVYGAKPDLTPQRTGIVAQSHGRSIDFPVAQPHYFVFTKAYERWDQIAGFAKKTAQMNSNEPQAK